VRRFSRVVASAAVVAPLATPVLGAQTPARRAVSVSDLYRLHDVRDPQLSPDGRWVAYTVTTVDSAKDRSTTHVWMTSWDGATTLQATTSAESEHTPHWSPDNRYLAFLSARGGARSAQVWLLDRRGGEAMQLTDVKQSISDFAWSPDGTRLVLVAHDADSSEADSGTPPKPIVIDRYHFKNDEDGYLGARHQHLYLFDIATRTLSPLTTGPYDDDDPAWSPDGRRIAFQGHRGADPDRDGNTDIFVIDARPGATPTQLTTFGGPDEGPLAWSPDGRLIAYLQGSEPKYSAYSMNRLAIVPAAGGPARVVSPALDREVVDPAWSPDGASIVVMVVDDRARYLARVRVADGTVARIIDGPRVVRALSQDARGALAVLASTPTQPAEVFAVDGDSLRRLSHANDAWLATVQLATTEGITARSRDGTIVNGLLVKPAGFVAGRRYPTLLRIHGGPNGQDQYEFNLERELFAANGYVVVTANYRGSSGRGERYGTSIFADWGHKEVEDLLAIVDRAVALGVADPGRLGIGGWSYGAILTDYTIASDRRFKAATSGAGSALQLAMYGVDEYIVQYDQELGPPWKSEALWVKLSYPFFHADRIATPTLFLGGDKDFNVPLVGSEQMYQALRGVGVATQLVIYPGQHHGISRPSFQRDRLERYLAWYARYLNGGTNTTATGAAP
jgi:dipeptidyl aminopeptidase/acylaminoacyl peptidase